MLTTNLLKISQEYFPWKINHNKIKAKSLFKKFISLIKDQIKLTLLNKFLQDGLRKGTQL